MAAETLANDQEQRINQYLAEAGFAGTVQIAKYDRGTSHAERERLRRDPPHLLLTNYMMLEYLLVRPADREAIFANHRCRFLVLDEVHTYRDVLGSNIALLVRRLKVHLAHARQNWKPDVADEERAKRYPKLVPVGTSATIKTVTEEGLSAQQRTQLRDQAVQEFFATLVGVEPASIRVFGEQLEDVRIPAEASYPAKPGTVDVRSLDISQPEAVRQGLCRLAGLPADTPLAEAARRYRLLWDLNRWLIGRPMSASQIVAQARAEAPDRRDTPDDRLRAEIEADDRSAGYPLRRFAEFGILPGYEFPSEPAALRLLGDPHEEDPISVTRRFGIGQFQPEAHVYARSKRWKVIGLDMASPWNPRSEGPTWSYCLCPACGLRFNAGEPKCPRCGYSESRKPLPSCELAGFVACPDETPILDEEERDAERNLVRTYPQWDGDVVGRWTLANGWALRLAHNEEVRWLNEGKPPAANDPPEAILHPDARGYLVCTACGRMLTAPLPTATPRGGRRNPKKGKQDDVGHAEGCPRRGGAPVALAISTSGKAEVLRLLIPAPDASRPDEWQSWGLSLGYSLLAGMQHFFMLDANELDFELEGPWKTEDAAGRYSKLSLAFIDPSLGGTGYLHRIAEHFDAVARRAIEHLDHPVCENACYRCLKSYQNQRFHEHLAWPQVMPALEELIQAPPSPRPLETGDIDDPRPWLEAYATGVGSPLELKFLRLFEQHGFHPQKQVQVALNPSDPPISVADFAVPERRLAIYIDGAAFHTGLNLRRDRNIRDRLRHATPPWRVEELRAADLAQGAALVERLAHQ